MKIVILSTKFPPRDIGGAEISAYNIAKLLSKKHDVHVITRKQKTAKHDGFKIHFTRYVDKGGFPVRYTTTSINFISKIRKIRPDIIYAEALYSAGFAGAIAGKVLGIPVIMRLAGEIYWIKGKVEKRIVRFILKNSDLVLALTAHMKKEVLKHQPKSKIDIVGEGVDYQAFRKARPKKLPKNTIMYLGRLVDMKGPKYIIKAFKLVKEQVPDANLIIGGYGEEEKKLRALAKKLKLNIAFKKIGSEKASYMKGCDVFALPSLSEGFPLVLAEAMSCGAPIVSTDVRGLPEIVQDGVNGYLVKPRDEKQMADRIIHLLKNPKIRKRMSKRNIRDAKKYSWEAIVKEIDKKLNSLV